MHIVMMAVVLCMGSARVALAQSQSARATDRALQLATGASLIVTGALGTLNAINQPTLFSDGRCAQGRPLLGAYGCEGLGPLHGLFSMISLVLYTATITYELSKFDDWPGRRPHGAGFDTLSYVHLVGMAVQPIGGLLAVVPELLGARRNSTFSRVMRTIHVVTGAAIVSAFVITTSIEL